MKSFVYVAGPRMGTNNIMNGILLPNSKKKKKKKKKNVNKKRK